MASDGEPRSSVHLLMQWDIFLTNKTAAPSEHLCNPLIIQADLFIYNDKNDTRFIDTRLHIKFTKTRQTG